MPKAVRYSLVLVLAVLVAACGAQQLRISGKPPQWDIRNLDRDGQNIRAALGVRNVNDAPLQLDRLSLEIRLDDNLLMTVDEPLDLVVPSRGREVIRVEYTAALAGLEQLERLDSGDADSLPWRLAGNAVTDGGSEYEIDTEGWLYPVPGRAGHYR